MDFNLGLTDREIRSLVTSIILQAALLHAPESRAAAGAEGGGRQQITSVLEISLQAPPAGSQCFPPALSLFPDF